ncbi:hypothetical protein BH10PAT3_BH10PAT3_2850 [soil metagenome]
MKRVWNYVVTMWQPAGILAVAGLILIVLFSYKIGSLVKNTAPEEAYTRSSSLNIKTILDNPVNAPYKTSQYVVRHIHESIVAERLISGLAAGMTVILFYFIVRRFSNPYAAGFATALYASSSSLLLNGRLASAHISQLLLLFLLFLGYRLRFNNRRTSNWLAGSVLIAVCLYTPGMVYFVGAVAIWQYRKVNRTNDRPKPKIVGVCIAMLLVLLIPLIYGLVQTPGLLHEYFGIPSALPDIRSLLKSILSVPAGIFLFAPKNALYRLGRQPILDVFTAFMFLIGCYGLVRRYRLDRLILFGGIFTLTCLYVALTGDYENSLLLLPFVYLVVGMGMSLLIGDWNRVFPNNPLARWLALVVMTVAVVVSCNFQARRYFIAWPNNKNTKAVFSIQ